jgi:hypothetical protein
MKGLSLKVHVPAYLTLKTINQALEVQTKPNCKTYNE